MREQSYRREGPYRRAASNWVEYVWPENTREYYANENTAIPTEDTPDF